MTREGARANAGTIGTRRLYDEHQVAHGLVAVEGKDKVGVNRSDCIEVTSRVVQAVSPTRAGIEWA